MQIVACSNFTCNVLRRCVNKVSKVDRPKAGVALHLNGDSQFFGIVAGNSGQVYG